MKVAETGRTVLDRPDLQAAWGAAWASNLTLLLQYRKLVAAVAVQVERYAFPRESVPQLILVATSRIWTFLYWIANPGNGLA